MSAIQVVETFWTYGKLPKPKPFEILLIKHTNGQVEPFYASVCQWIGRDMSFNKGDIPMTPYGVELAWINYFFVATKQEEIVYNRLSADEVAMNELAVNEVAMNEFSDKKEYDDYRQSGEGAFPKAILGYILKVSGAKTAQGKDNTVINKTYNAVTDPSDGQVRWKANRGSFLLEGAFEGYLDGVKWSRIPIK